MDSPIAVLCAGLLCAFLIARRDFRQRRLTFSRSTGWNFLTALDLLGPAITSGVGGTLIYQLILTAISQSVLPLRSPGLFGILAASAIFVFLNGEARRQIQFQRPAGIVFGEFLILGGAYQLIESMIFSAADWPGAPHGTAVRVLCVAAIVTGGIVIAVIVPPFVKGYEGHRILERVAEQGESVQPEYTPATPECPHPEWWKMVDSQTTELEIIDFLGALVVAMKPRLIVETGTFLGYSTIKMAEGLKANGFGKIITIEFDPAIFAKAKERIDASGLGSWIEYRNESSLETRIDGTIDILFSDSHLTIREQEIRRLLPQIDPRGLILVHDASSHFGVVREAALRMEQEGLISVVLLPTPRGLVIAQKREGRK